MGKGLDKAGRLKISKTDSLVFVDNSSIGIMPYGYNPTQKLDIKGRLSLKSKLILFFKRYVAERT